MENPWCSFYFELPQLSQGVPSLFRLNTILWKLDDCHGKCHYIKCTQNCSLNPWMCTLVLNWLWIMWCIFQAFKPCICIELLYWRAWVWLNNICVAFGSIQGYCGFWCWNEFMPMKHYNYHWILALVNHNIISCSLNLFLVIHWLELLV